MARFVAKRPVRVLADEVVLNDKGEELEREYIEIKPKLSMGDRNKLYGAIMQVNAQDRTMEANLERYLKLILELSVRGWKLYGRDEADGSVLMEGGSPVEVPFHIDYIQDLDADDPLVDKVVEEIGRLNPTLMVAGTQSTSQSSNESTTSPTAE